MSHPLRELAELVSAAVVRSFGAEHAEIDPAVHRSAFADYQADVALKLARAIKRPPLEVANTLRDAIDASGLCDEVKVSPPGFVNFSLRADVLERLALEVAADPRAAAPTTLAPRTVVIDYSGPNVAKELHVGHIRSTVIGDALARVLVFAGHRVVRQNHVGDWGTPFGMLVEHLLDLGSDQALADLAMGAFSEFYKAARQKFDGDPAFAERARQRVVLLQSGDERTLGLWRTLVEASFVYLRGIYSRLGVTLTDADVRGESFYNPMLPDVAAELEQLGVASVDQGALCVMLPEFKGREGEPVPLIVRKQDGGFGYAATDLAALRFRVQKLGAERILYVVGAPQQQHLAMVFATAKKAGWLPATVSAEHVPFGLLLGADRKLFRSRAGDTPRLSDLIEEAVQRADQEIQAKSPELPADERARVALAIGVGALKYADLSSERIKDYVFDLNRMVSFEGNTGPYLQYAHARICSILRKAAADGHVLAAALLEERPFGDTQVLVREPAERALALDLLGLGGVVDGVVTSLQPHRLCTYLHELASRFTTFYESCPVLKAPSPELRDSRLVLCGATRRVLGVGLGLLGISAPERM
jgi:arginyl-tRNA synthetase